MSDFERNEIIYEEGWRTREPLTADPLPGEGAEAVPEPDAETSAKKRAASKPLLISIQLIVCAVAALVLFLLKTMDSPAYHSFMIWYRTEMNRPLISQTFFEALDVSRLASADEVRVEASPDELLPR